MIRANHIINVITCTAMLAVSNLSLACRPQFPDVAIEIPLYTQNKIPNGVVFSGAVVSVAVVSVSKARTANYVDAHGITTVYDIVFRPIRWFGGVEKREITVRGVTGSGNGTDCMGVFDFFPRVGEQWLIFGQLREGKVDPTSFLSSQIVGGKLPTEYRAAFKRNGINF